MFSIHWSVFFTWNKAFMLQSTHKMANLNQNEICAELRSRRQYKQHDGKNGYVKFAHSRSIKLWKSNTNTTETFIKNLLPAKVRAINCLENTNHRNKEEAGMGRRRAEEKFLCVNEIKNATSIIRWSINTTFPKDATLNLKFKSVPLIPCS